MREKKPEVDTEHKNQLRQFLNHPTISALFPNEEAHLNWLHSLNFIITIQKMICMLYYFVKD